MDENLPDKIDELYNGALQKFKARPSEEVWNKIEGRLDEDDRKIARLSFGWKQYAAAGIFLIGLGALLKSNLNQGSVENAGPKLQEKRGIITLVAPKAIQREAHLETKPDLLLKEWREKRNPPVIGSNPAVQASISYKKRVNQEINMQNSELTSDPESAMAHITTAQHVESGLTPVHLTELAIPLKSISDQAMMAIVHLKTRFKDRFSVTPYFSQEFAGYSLTDNDLTGVNGQEIEERERNVFSASVGFYVNYKINKKWVLQSGISYSWSNSNIDSATSYAVKDDQGNIQFKVNTISGYGYLQPASSTQPSVGDSVYTAKSYSQLHYLTVPLILSYRIPLRRFSLLIGAGGSFNVLTNAQLETKTYGNGNPEKEYTVSMLGLKKVNYGMLVKFDLEYHINSELGIDIMPCFKNTLSPINLETPVTAYPYNVGLGIGLIYRF